jgi:uroporphyrinogen-III synthase
MTHILVTRPLEASQQLADQLAAHGMSPVVMPLYTFAACQPAAGTATAWSAIHRRKLAVFTSPRAVQFGCQFIPPHNQLDGLQIAVVGSATRAALEASGYPVHIQAHDGFTSEDLLQAPELSEDPGVAVIFCAPDGRDALKEGLDRLGWKTLKAMVYERVPLKPDPIQVDLVRNATDLISIWTSISSLKLAEKYLPPDVWGKILESSALVISSRIRQHLVQLGASRVELADGPGNAELLQSVLRLTRQTPVG